MTAPIAARLVVLLMDARTGNPQSVSGGLPRASNRPEDFVSCPFLNANFLKNRLPVHISQPHGRRQGPLAEAVTQYATVLIPASRNSCGSRFCGRRTRFLRCAPRRFAFATSPAACN